MHTFRRLIPVVTLVIGASVAPASHAQNAVADWQAIAEATIAGGGRKNAVALPQYAYVHVAMYDAVNSIGGHYQPFAVDVQAPQGASRDAAAAQAAHDVLVHHFPAQAAALDAHLVTSLAAIADGSSKTAGIAVGQSVAAQWIAKRASDGLEAPVTYTPGHGPGIWEPVPTVPAPPPNTPPAPVGVWLASFTPFALKSADQFLKHVPAPPSLTSALWARDFNRTKDYGARNSTVRTAAETEIGRFWTDDAAQQYGRAFRNLITTQHLDVAASARLGAMLYVATADAIAACFNAKYHYAFWRPYTAIHDADTDGNPNTVADSNWVPLAVTPGHPEYPAAHGCGTEAAMDALAAFFGTDEIPLTVTSQVTGTTHSFNSLEDVVDEVDNARVYGGMHYRNSTKQGNRLGRRVVDFMTEHYFQHRDESPED